MSAGSAWRMKRKLVVCWRVVSVHCVRCNVGRCSEGLVDVVVVVSAAAVVDNGTDVRSMSDRELVRLSIVDVVVVVETRHGNMLVTAPVGRRTAASPPDDSHSADVSGRALRVVVV